MKRFASMALALTASLMLAAAVQARGPGGIHTSNKVVVSQHDFGHHTLSGHTIYRGSEHHHWSHTYWDSRYGCYLYWDPYATCYYYYCVPAGCYYPISYCPYNTYCWQQPTGGVLPGPVANVPTLKSNVVGNVSNNQGLARTPLANAQLPPDVPPPQGGPMVPVR